MTRRPAFVPRLLAAAAVSLLSLTAAQAQSGGKLYATSGGWEVRKYGNDCVAQQSFDGDQAFRVRASANGTSSFGFRADGTADGPIGATVKVTYWFGNTKRNSFTREAKRVRLTEAEGGTVYLVFQDPAGEPTNSIEGPSSINFDYVIDGTRYEAGFNLRGLSKAYEKMWTCSGG